MVVNFYNHIHGRLISGGDKVSIVWPVPGSNSTSEFTSHDILLKISSYRSQFLERRTKAGDAILFAIPVSVDLLCAILAVQSIGAVPILPPPKIDLLTLISIIRKQKIKKVITEKSSGFMFFTRFLGATCNTLTSTITRNTSWQPALVPPSQVALVSYSSGSTGKPKAIYRSHQVLSAQHAILKTIFPPTIWQNDFPLFPNIILHNLAAGIRTIMPCISGFKLANLDPEVVAKQLLNYDIDTLTGNVFYFKKLFKYLESTSQVLPDVKAVGVGGSPVTENLAKGLMKYFTNAKCYIIYGSSEAEPISVRELNNSFEDPLSGFAVGKVVDGLELRLINTMEIQTPKGYFAAGEIEVRGAHVASVESDGWLNTGDIGYLSAENLLYLSARKGNEKPHKRFQHYQVEHLILQQNGVENAAAISSSDGFRLFVTGNVTEAKIWEVINFNLPEGVITKVKIEAQIPLDERHQSKILYNKLSK